jgi:hypothetical protein
MQHPAFRGAKSYCPLLLICAAAFLQPACETLTTNQRSALLTGAETLAQTAVAAAAAYHGGSGSAALASDGLSALGAVLQAYVGATVPAPVVAASPGVPGVGGAVAKLISNSRAVSQSDVDTVNAAAALATGTPAAPAQ